MTEITLLKDHFLKVVHFLQLVSSQINLLINCHSIVCHGFGVFFYLWGGCALTCVRNLLAGSRNMKAEFSPNEETVLVL